MLTEELSATNAPAVNLAQALEPSRLADYLNYEFAEHEARAAELAAAFERFLLATKDGINDDETTGRATDFAKVHKAELAAIDATRSRVKAPVLHAQRLVDGAGKKLADPLKASVAVIEDRMAAYLRRKAEAARREAEAEAQRLAAAAHEAMREAEAAPGTNRRRHRRAGRGATGRGTRHRVNARTDAHALAARRRRGVAGDVDLRSRRHSESPGGLPDRERRRR